MECPSFEHGFSVNNLRPTDLRGEVGIAIPGTKFQSASASNQEGLKRPKLFTRNNCTRSQHNFSKHEYAQLCATQLA